MKAVFIVALAVLCIALAPVFGYGFWAGTKWAVAAMGGTGEAKELATLSTIFLFLSVLVIAWLKLDVL